MTKAEPNSCCCGECASAINLGFETVFDRVGRCVFRCPLLLLLVTIVFYGVCCIFVNEIESADDIKELILGDNSLVIRIGEWRDKFLSTSNWGRCVTGALTTSQIPDPTFAPTCVDDPGGHSADLAVDGSIGSMTILGIDRNIENVLTAEYLLAYKSILERFLKDWNTTCDEEFEGKVFGYKDVAVFEQFDESFEAVAEFPIRNSGILRCFKEGWWASYENPANVVDMKPRLSFDFEFSKKDSLWDIYNNGTSSEGKLDKLTTALHTCWIYTVDYPQPFSFTLGGSEYPEYTAEDMPRVGDWVMANVGTNDWRAGVIHSIEGDDFIVMEAIDQDEKLCSCTVAQLRRKVSKAIGVQSIFPIAVHDQFAKRVQRRHYDFCDTTGDLNGTYDCTNDDHFDWILERSEVCHRKIIGDMTEAIRRANNEEDILIDILIFTPFDEENILDYISDTSEIMVVICLCIMIVFIAAIALNPCNPMWRKALVGTVGVLLVYYSTMAGMGLCRMVFHSDFTPATLQALPFMGLGLGVDDMLVLLWTYKYQPSKQQINDEICRAVREAGLSITLTSMTNFLSFVVGAQMPLKELSYFSVTAACVMFTNYIGIVFAFSSLLVLHNSCSLTRRYTRSNSIMAKISNKVLYFDDDDEAAKETLGFTKVKEVSQKALRPIPSIVILIISLAILFVALFLSPSPEWGLRLNDLIPDDHPMKSFWVYQEEYFNTMPATFGFGFLTENGQPEVHWENYYKLRYRDIVSFNSELSNVSTVHFTLTWLMVFENWVTTNPGNAGISYGSDIPDEDRTSVTLLQYVNSTNYSCPSSQIASCTACLSDSDCDLLSRYSNCYDLLQAFIVGGRSAEFCGSLSIIECPEYRYGGGACQSESTANYRYIGRAGVCDTPPTLSDDVQTTDEGPYYTAKNESLDKEGCMEWCDLDDTCIGFVYWMWPVVEDLQRTFQPRGCRLFNNASDDCTNVNSSITTSEGAMSFYKSQLSTDCTQKTDWMEDEQYQDNCFMDLLREWATETDAKDYWAKELIWSSGNSKPGPFDYLVGAESGHLISTGAMGDPFTGPEAVDDIEDSRAVAENYDVIGAYVTGISYEYYDQLFEVRAYLFLSLYYVTIAVFCCSLLFILHPIAAFLMLISLVVTLVELWGFLRWAEIKVNGVLALNMVIACGVSVEFSAHINRRFMLAKGTPRERLGTSLGVLFIPVALGAATSIIAVSFMAWSDNPYTRIYYFRLFSTMIALGWWNGTFFQSVLILAVAKCLEGTVLEMATINRGAQNGARKSTSPTDPGERLEMADGLKMKNENAVTSDASPPPAGSAKGETSVEGEPSVKGGTSVEGKRPAEL